MNQVLARENIILNCASRPKEEIIRGVGRRMVENGFCKEEYVEGMIAKERVFNTAIGNQVAIPHGIEPVRDAVLNTGLVIMVFPQGTDWDAPEPVRLVIGIAARDNEHMGVLSRIAILCSDPQNVDRIVKSSADEIYALFNSEAEL